MQISFSLFFLSILLKIKLYCCTDYREYVEALIEAQTEKSVVNQLINIKPHPKTKNKKEKNLAKQRAEQRYVVSYNPFTSLFFLKLK